MKILHYALGFAPFRSGGMTKYVMDLVQIQQRQGENVALLWPGSYCLIKRTVRIGRRKEIDGIGSYELHNPLPVPLMDGIKNVPMYVKKGSYNVYLSFLKAEKPDIIHMHTFMGIHQEFFQAAGDLKIPILFTAHDYFPFCPRTTLFCQGSICEGMSGQCAVCSRNALSMWKIFILQSPIYRKMKDFAVVKKLRGNHKKKISILDSEEKKQYKEQYRKEENQEDSQGSYGVLQQRYQECLRAVSCIHFGSRLVEAEYRKRGFYGKSCYIPMTHAGIMDRRELRTVHDCLQFAFLADIQAYKGFWLLCDVLDELWDEGIRFHLHVYTRSNLVKPYIILHAPYEYGEIAHVFSNVDMVVAPSLWPETFGFVVLEALSFGVPVMVSENVGAKDLLTEQSPKGMIVEAKKAQIKDALLHICRQPQILEEYSRNIINDKFEYSMEEHFAQMNSLYRELQGKR